jgi:guanine nucleotide-binding protein G(i) subunit alpha
MGNCTSAQQDKVEKDISDEIDRQIEEDSKKFRKECKILLLGSGEGGKSTIVKQMKIIHQNGYTPEELLKFKYAIYTNLVESAQNVVKALTKTGLNPLEPQNRVGDNRHLPEQTKLTFVVRAIQI